MWLFIACLTIQVCLTSFAILFVSIKLWTRFVDKPLIGSAQFMVAACFDQFQPRRSHSRSGLRPRPSPDDRNH